MKSTVVDESLSSFKPMYCSREYQASTRKTDYFAKIHQGKGCHKRRIIQKALPHRCRIPQILWSSKDPLGCNAIEAHSVKHWDSRLWNIQELARILKPWVGKSPHHVKNIQDFIQQIKGIHLNLSQCMMSYDVKALFTSVPTTPAAIIIKKLLEQDHELQHSTSISVENIICLLEFCLNSTYFMFQGKYFK